MAKWGAVEKDGRLVYPDGGSLPLTADAIQEGDLIHGGPVPGCPGQGIVVKIGHMGKNAGRMEGFMVDGFAGGSVGLRAGRQVFFMAKDDVEHVACRPPLSS